MVWYQVIKDDTKSKISEPELWPTNQQANYCSNSYNFQTKINHKRNTTVQKCLSDYVLYYLEALNTQRK